MIRTPMMILLRENEVLDHALIEREVEEIAACGFDAVCLEFRNTTYNEFDDYGNAALQLAYRKTKALGLGFVKILSHCPKELYERIPDFHKRVTKGYVTVREGNGWTVQGDLLLEGIAPDGIFAAFTKNFERTDCDEFSFDGTKVRFSSKAKDVALVYLTYTMDSPDYANPEAEQIALAYLEVCRDLELDGFALDEFGAGARLDKVYLANTSFLDLFAKKYGYDFREAVYLMDRRGKDNTFAKVRFDYFSMTNEVTYVYQKKVKDLFTKRYGEDIFIGFHHTWFGEGNSGDLWAGNINYFELGRNLSGGFVDAQYDSERTMTSMGLLAESIAKYTTGRAYDMCWDRNTTPQKMDYFHRMLSVRNIHWVGHAVSPQIAREEPFSNAMVASFLNNEDFGNIKYYIDREHLFEEFIGKAQGRAKVAILYLWESCAYFNDDYMHFHRLSLKALADKLILNNIPVDIVPSFETDFTKYEVIFALWPVMVPKKLWEALKREIVKGKKVYFIGPPARVTTDGEDISREFDEIVGRKICYEYEFMGGYEYCAWDLWFTEKRIHMRSYQDEKHHMNFYNGNVRYYGYELPITDMFYNVLEELSEYQTVHSSKVISKEFYDGETAVLTLTARWQGKIEEKIQFGGHVFEIHNGTIVGIRLVKGSVDKIISESGAEILAGGKRYRYDAVDGEKVFRGDR